jgi:hypothetical protein
LTPELDAPVNRSEANSDEQQTQYEHVKMQKNEKRHRKKKIQKFSDMKHPSTNIL